MKTLLVGVGTFIRRGRLKEGGVHKLFLILGGVFIEGRRLKEVGHLLEDLPYTEDLFMKFNTPNFICKYFNESVNGGESVNESINESINGATGGVL